MRRIFCALLFTVTLTAQTAPPALKIGNVVVTGSVRSRLESWEWFRGEADPSYNYLGNVLRLGFSQQKERYDWMLEFEAPVLLGLPEHSIAPGVQGQLGTGASYFAANDGQRNVASIFAKQGYIRLRHFGTDAATLRIGRFEFLDGSETTPKDATLAAVKRDRVTQRLIGNFGWTHVGRSFDGLQYVYNRPTLNVTLMGFVPTRGVFQTDGWGDLKVSVVYGSVTKPVPMAEGAGEWRLFAMHYGDFRDGVVKTDSRALALRRADADHIQIGTFGGHYLHARPTTAGTFDFLAWGALQTGNWGNLSHRAGAALLEAGFQPTILKRVKPWVRAGLNYGSGDSNAADGTHGTFFQVLPTPRPFARFPFFNMMNNRDLFAELILRLARQLTVRSDVHSLRLTQRNDLWYLGGGAFQPWSFGYTGRATLGSGLATLYDVSADYVVNPHFTVAAYYGYANGKSAVRSVYPKGSDGHLGYVEFGYRF